jgi:hypothetical protein
MPMLFKGSENNPKDEYPDLCVPPKMTKGSSGVLTLILLDEIDSLSCLIIGSSLYIFQSQLITKQEKNNSYGYHKDNYIAFDSYSSHKQSYMLSMIKIKVIEIRQVNTTQHLSTTQLSSGTTRRGKPDRKVIESELALAQS